MKKTMIFIVLWCFVFAPTFFGFEIFSKNIAAQTLENLTPGMLEKLSPGEIEQLKQSLTSGRKEKIKPIYGLSPFDKEGFDKEGFDKKESELKIQKGPSVIEKQYQNSYASALSSNLEQFGYDIFRSSKLKPSNLAIPGTDYLIGPGDQLRIRVWGSGLDAEYSVIVDKQGYIALPKLGVIPLSGVKFGHVESIIKKEAQKYIHGINLSVALTRLRSLEVYIVGAVENPGLHIVPYFSTILDGLIAADGVKKTGTLRNIKLYRNDKVKKIFDIYDLLLRGNRNSDKMLQNRDVIFVSGIGHTAAVAGALNNEAIFEIKKQTSVKDLVAMAGGMLPQAMDSRIDLRRFDKNKEFIVIDLKNKSIDQWNKIFVQNGDLIGFGVSKLLLHDIVVIGGHVWDHDIFQFKQGMKLSDVLTSIKILKPDALTKFALIHRYDKVSTMTTAIRFPLADVFKGTYDKILQPFDKIEVLSRKDFGMDQKFTISGSVWKQGEFEYQPGLRLKDALALAGGLKFGARTNKIEVARQYIKGDWMQTEYIVLNTDKDGDFVLKPYDSILIPQIKNASLVKQVTITGEVAYPGTYTIREGEKVSDLITRAGGFSEYAYFYGAKYTSIKAREIQQKSIDQMIDKLRLTIMQTTSEMAQTSLSEKDVKAAEVSGEVTQGLLDQLTSIKAEGRISIRMADLISFKSSLYDFRLKDGDTIDIPSKPSFVSVVGSVYSPGSFLYEPNQKLKFYLSKSGGVAKTADEDYIYVLKANGEILSMSQNNKFFSKFMDTTLMPGDTIVVPEDLERIGYLKLISDVSDIIFKIATTAGVAVALSL